MINDSLIDKLPVKIALESHGFLQIQSTDRSGIKGEIKAVYWQQTYEDSCPCLQRRRVGCGGKAGPQSLFADEKL